MARHSPDPKINALTNLGIFAMEPVAIKLRKRLLNILVKRLFDTPVGQLITMARKVLADMTPIYAQVVSDFQLEAWVRGLEAISSRTPNWIIQALKGTAGIVRKVTQDEALFANVLTGNVTDSPNTFVKFPEMVSRVYNLFSRGVLRKPDFQNVSRQIAQRSFTVAHIASERKLERIRDLLAKSRMMNTGLDEFTDKVIDVVGDGVLTIPHIENVFRTNIQKAYTEGREHMMTHPLVGNMFPYIAYNAIDDSRVRDEHLALMTLGLDGTNVYRADDPFWSRFMPPWSWNCRCGTTRLTIRQAARRGVNEAQEWLDSGQPPMTPEWRYMDIPFEPDPEFVPVRVGGQIIAA